MQMEFLDIVDENDNIVGQASKQDIYSKKLTHRIVHVFIFNDKNELALQLRSDKMSFCPGHWVISAGGHVHAGESPKQAILRECQEELGVQGEMKFLGKDLYIAPGIPKKFLISFTAAGNGPFAVNKEEVERVDFFSLDKIKEMIAMGEKFHPELLFLLKKYYFL